MAAAQIFPSALAAEAAFGIAPAMAASPITWIFGTNCDSNVIGSTGHHPVRSATPAVDAICAGPLRRDHIGNVGLVALEIRDQRLVGDVDLGQVAALR